MTVLKEKFRAKRLRAVRAALDAEARGLARASAIWLLLVVASPMGLPAIGLTMAGDSGGGFTIGLMIGIGLAIFAFRRRSAAQRKRRKFEFASVLLEQLGPDLHPTAKQSLSLDPRHYDDDTKLTWSGRSSHGNPKRRYTDKWLDFGFVLADGTRVRVRCQAGIKLKSGNVVKEKRRVFLRVLPGHIYDAHRAGQIDPKLKRSLKAGLRSLFPNAPEEFHAHVDSSGQSIDIRVTQEDCAVTPEEVTSLVGAVGSFLSTYRLPVRGEAHVAGA